MLIVAREHRGASRNRVGGGTGGRPSASNQHETPQPHRASPRPAGGGGGRRSGRGHGVRHRAVRRPRLRGRSPGCVRAARRRHPWHHQGPAPRRGAAALEPALPSRRGNRARVAAAACRVPPQAPLSHPAPWRILCPMAAGPSHPARAIVSRPGCRVFCWIRAGALARCGPIWGCWNVGQQAGLDLICAEGPRSPQDVTPGRAAAG
jgi:hypothetical protein